MSRRIHGKRKAISANHIRKTNSDRKATRKMLQSGEDGGKIEPPLEQSDPGSNWGFIEVEGKEYKHYPELNMVRIY